jgi:hypothetical protein
MEGLTKKSIETTYCKSNNVEDWLSMNAMSLELSFYYAVPNECSFHLEHI